MPYLDAVFLEVLRIHAPVDSTTRQVRSTAKCPPLTFLLTDRHVPFKAACDDVIPLSRPIATASGEVVDHITVARGTTVVIPIPIRTVNRSEEIWGPDSKEFKPERWIDNESGLPARTKKLQGYHHIVSFVDGQRFCLGRVFAAAEFKVSKIIWFVFVR